MFSQPSSLRRKLVLAAAVCLGLWFGPGLSQPLHAQQPDPATQLYVSDMGISYKFVGGPRRLAVAMVDIVDGNGLPVNDVLVIGDWSDCFKQLNDSEFTESIYFPVEDLWVDGRATIWANKSHSCQGKACKFTFTITGVFKNGMTYVPVNGMTSASAPCN